MSVGTEFPKEQARLRELREAYVKIGPAGRFGLASIDVALIRADLALASGDVVRILGAHQRMTEITG